MSGFSLVFCGGADSQRFDGIMHFIGADDSGVFGILPRHELTVAVLRYGLARFVDVKGSWRYAALPGGVLRFAGDAMVVVAASYFIGTERGALADQLGTEMRREDSELRAMRETLAGIDNALLRRLNALGQAGTRSTR